MYRPGACSARSPTTLGSTSPAIAAHLRVAVASRSALGRGCARFEKKFRRHHVLEGYGLSGDHPGRLSFSPYGEPVRVHRRRSQGST